MGLGKKTIDDQNYCGKKVLVRCDFNVPMKDGVITNENRINAALPTIQKLVNDGAKVILCSHLGKPKNGPEAKFSLAPVAVALSAKLGKTVVFADDDNVVGENAKAAVAAMNNGDVVLLQNTRATINTIFRNEAFLMRIVVKVGTSTLAHPTGRLNIQRMEELCKVLSDLKNAGHEIILVSSGAIAMGFGKLNLRQRPKDTPTKQASAAVGQCELMYMYDKLFTEYSHTVAQLLITAPDIADGGNRKQNFHNTLERLLELGALPIVNENDTISTEEFGIGDNDTLSAVVAATVHADLLVLLSDIDGLYDGDPHKNPDAKLIHTVERIDEHILALGGGSGSELGTGGMATKLTAAVTATEAGCEMVIANGAKLKQLYDIVDGGHVGTRFLRKQAEA